MACLTDGERKVISLAWQCFKSIPEVDYKKLQELGGYKTAASATSCYLAARKKILSTTTTNATTPKKLTEGENKVLVMAWQCFKVAPQVDYRKLAQLGSYKTPASATSCYRAARKKLLGSASDTAARAPIPASRKRKSTPADGEVDAPTETKRVRKLNQDPVKAAEETDLERGVEGEGDAEDAVMVKTERSGELGHLFATAKEFLDREERGAEV